MEKVLDALDKLEECANGMKDLPKSNWIDLADNDVELDLKIMEWVEEIRLELFKGRQAIDDLEAIKEANPSKAIECLEKVKGYRTGGIISVEVYLEETEEYDTIKQALLKLDFLEDANDLPINCTSHFKNRNGDEVVVMRRERYNNYERLKKIVKDYMVNSRGVMGSQRAAIAICCMDDICQILKEDN